MKIKKTTFDFENFEWVDIHNPATNNLDKYISEYNLDFHQVKDSQERGHLPKFEKHDDYNFIILRAITSDIDDRITNMTELSNKMAIFYNEKNIITIHRTNFDFQNEIPSNFQKVETLVLYIIHKMLKSYTAPMSKLSKKNDDFENDIFLHVNIKVSLDEIYVLKTQSRIIKKLLLLIQSAVSQIEVSDSSKTSLQDLKDNLLSLIIGYEEIYENSNNLLNTFITISSQKSNDVMKLLTIFSAFFLPLTFIVGIYGMNFENMPELKWHYGYYMSLGFMLLVSIIIFIWFKKRKII